MLYLGCAALLLATVLLGLPVKMRAAFFTAMILAAIVGEPEPQVVQPVAIQIFAAAD
jgi:hypothetical protein